jgi:hypothetical protein
LECALVLIWIQYITARSSREVKTRAKDAVANIFKFQYMKNTALIAKQRAHVMELKDDFTYTYYIK